MAKDTLDAQIVHCHTWYTDMARPPGRASSGASPCVLTIHSLEPLRPWKAEQLGNGYHLSSLDGAHRHRGRPTPIIAVSKETREDVLRLFA